MGYYPGRCLLLERLHERGWSQQDLADRLNMPRSQISDYIHNRKVMTLKTAKTIAAELSKRKPCKIDDLYEWHQTN